PAPGTGKSYLWDIVSYIATGKPCPVISVSKEEPEIEKRLVGMLLAGVPLVSIDNINGTLGSDLLCQAVERPVVMVRGLGKSTMYEIEACATFLSNGNNITITADTTRRTVMTNLDSGVERPELREFKFDPRERVLQNRGAYIAACLTIVRHYMLIGYPR